MGRPIRSDEILWAYSWAGFQTYMGLYWAVSRVNVSLAILVKWTVDICPKAEPTHGPSANENFTRGKSPLVRAVNGLSDPNRNPIA